MADPLHYPTSENSSVEHDRGSTAGLPIWLRVLGIVLAVGLLVLLVVLHLTGVVGPGTQ